MHKERVEVVAYSGYRGEEIPRAFKREGTKVEVAVILNRWVEEGAGDRVTKRGFRLIGTDGNAYSLIYDERTQEWFCESKNKDIQSDPEDRAFIVSEPTMDIVLVPVGEVDPVALDMLKDDLHKILQKAIWVGKGLGEPYYAFNSKRDQYLSTAILKVILEQKDFVRYERILGIVDHDLYVPGLNFVFGEASPRAAVISLTRLKETYYGHAKNPILFRKRILIEAVHELGHTYGFEHCRNASCVMFFSNRLEDTDRKGPGFCPECKKRYDALQRSR